MPLPARTRRPIIAALCAFFACGGGAVWAQAPAPAAAQIAAFGRVVPGDRLTAVAVPSYNGAPGIVAELSVREGDRVTAGQKLAITHGHALALAELNSAHARYATAKARLEAVQAGPKPEEVAAQQEVIKGYEAELRGETARKIPSGQEAKDEASARQAAAAAKVAAARHQLAALQAPRPGDVEIAKAELSEAEAATGRAAAALSSTEISAPAAGRVLKIFTGPGESSAGRALLEMGDTDAMTVKAEVNVADLDRVQAGAAAIIKGEAFRGELHGKVSRVGLTVDRSSLTALSPFANVDRHIVEVTVVPDDPAKLQGKTGAVVTVLITPSTAAK